MKASSVIELRIAKLRALSKLTHPFCPTLADANLNPPTKLLTHAQNLPLPCRSKMAKPPQPVGNPLIRVASLLPHGYFPL
jgi:hypothetical protein